MMLWGVVLGRWPRTALLTAPAVWVVILWADPNVPIEESVSAMAGAALLGLANAAVGVGIHQFGLFIYRRAVRRGRVGDLDP